MLILLAALSACDRAPSANRSDPPQSLRGTISDLQGITLRPGAELELRVIQTSGSGGPAPVIGSARVLDPGPVPIRFEVPIEPVTGAEAPGFAIAARIVEQGRPLFVSPEPQPVASDALDEPTDLRLRRPDPTRVAGAPHYQCRGSEPFWHVSIDGDRLRIHRLLEQSVHWEFEGRYRHPGSSEAPMVWHGTDRASPVHRLTAWLTDQACGESDSDDGLAVAITLPDVVVIRGCCRRAGDEPSTAARHPDDVPTALASAPR
jgi:uncharacterized lipoprotein YbaY